MRTLPNSIAALLLVASSAFSGSFSLEADLYSPADQEIGYGANVAANFSPKLESYLDIARFTGPMALTVGQVVYIDGSGNIALARADAEATARVYGIITEAIDATTYRVKTGGRFTYAGTLTPGMTYFLSEVTAGALTTTEPTAPNLSIPIGVARDANTLVIPLAWFSTIGGSMANPTFQTIYDNDTNVASFQLVPTGALVVQDNSATSLLDARDQADLVLRPSSGFQLELQDALGVPRLEVYETTPFVRVTDTLGVDNLVDITGLGGPNFPNGFNALADVFFNNNDLKKVNRLLFNDPMGRITDLANIDTNTNFTWFITSDFAIQGAAPIIQRAGTNLFLQPDPTGSLNLQDGTNITRVTVNEVSPQITMGGDIDLGGNNVEGAVNIRQDTGQPLSLQYNSGLAGLQLDAAGNVSLRAETPGQTSALRDGNGLARVLARDATPEVVIVGQMNMSTNKIINVVDPTAAQDAATKNYADTNEANLDHDTLLNFVATEHVDHSTVSISGGTSLAGGGAITANRTLTLLNDLASPGNDQYYGTNSAGTKGYHPLVPGEYNYAESLASSTTTLGTFQTKLTLTTTSLPLGNYRLGWTYAWCYNSATNNFGAELNHVTTATRLMLHIQEPKDAGGTPNVNLGITGCGTDQVYRHSGFLRLTGLSGVHVFDLNYLSVGGAIAGIRDARLELWRVP